MEISIEWDNPTKSFNAGDTLTGLLIVNSSLEENAHMHQASCLTIIAEGSVKWTILTHTEDPDCPVDYRKLENRRTFLYRKVHFGIAAYEDSYCVPVDTTITPGSNNYPFQFTIPHSAPSSFEGAYGNITYHAEAVVHVVGTRELFKTKDTFEVTALYNLNNDPAAAVIGQCFLQIAGENDGLAGILVKIPKIGFVPGEILPIHAKINNKSTYFLQLRFFICQRDTFRIQDQVKCTYKVIDETTGPDISPGEVNIWKCTDFRMPNVKSIGSICDIIKSTYTLELEVMAIGRPSGFYPIRKFCRTGSIPIIIGTIPSENSMQGSSLGLFESFNEQTSFSPSAPPVEVVVEPVDPNEPPPSYDEVMAAGSLRRRSDSHSHRHKARRSHVNLNRHSYGTL